MKKANLIVRLSATELDHNTAILVPPIFLLGRARKGVFS